MKILISKIIAITGITISVAWANLLPPPPSIAAKAYVLVDLSSNQILAESNNANEEVEPASLTKLMTGYLVFEALKNRKISLDQKFSVSEQAWRMPGSRMFIDPKMQVSVEDLIKGMVVQSGNDATVALAEGVGGSQEFFVQLMNKKAKQLGLKNTNYKNPEGLTEEGHHTSAHDLSVLAANLLHDFPEYLQYSSLKEYHYPNTPESNKYNRNWLLKRDPSVDGLKTGHTEAAGYCLVATAQREINGNKRRLLSVVVGAESENARARESQKLLNWGYMAYDLVNLFKPNQEVASLKVWKGQESRLAVGFVNGLSLSVPADKAKNLTTEILSNGSLIAPITKNQVVAKLQIKLDKNLLREVNLYALQEVPESGFFGRLWDSFLMLFSS